VAEGVGGEEGGVCCRGSLFWSSVFFEEAKRCFLFVGSSRSFDVLFVSTLHGFGDTKTTQIQETYKGEKGNEELRGRRGALTQFDFYAAGGGARGPRFAGCAGCEVDSGKYFST